MRDKKSIDERSYIQEDKSILIKSQDLDDYQQSIPLMQPQKMQGISAFKKGPMPSQISVDAKPNRNFRPGASDHQFDFLKTIPSWANLPAVKPISRDSYARFISKNKPLGKINTQSHQEIPIHKQNFSDLNYSDI